MRTPSSADLLDAWDAGWRMAPSIRAVGLLMGGCRDEDPEALASLPVGERDGRLLELRERLFGHSMTGIVSCGACGERLEVEVATDELRVAATSIDAAGQSLTAGEWEARFRLPNSRDIASLEGLREEEPARRALLERCLLEVTRRGENVSAAEVPDDIAALIGQRMAAADPQATAEVAVACPDCNHSWSAPFDVGAFLWTEVDAWARRMLRQVHELATAYSWTEDEILRLSPARRARYLELIIG
jgi:hypothetical protein